LGAVQSSADAGPRLNSRHRPGAQAAVTASSALSELLRVHQAGPGGSIAFRTLSNGLKKLRRACPWHPVGQRMVGLGSPGSPPALQQLPGPSNGLFHPNGTRARPAKMAHGPPPPQAVPERSQVTKFAQIAPLTPLGLGGAARGAEWPCIAYFHGTRLALQLAGPPS
jgi:hypothetical protein